MSRARNNSGRFQKSEWSPDEIIELKKLVKDYKGAEIAQKLNKTYNEVRWQMRKQRIKAQRQDVWTFAELATISTHVSRHGRKSAMSHYNLSIHTVKKIVQIYNRKKREFAEAATPDRVNDLRKWSENYARTRGRPEESADFASYYVMLAITRPSIRLETAWLDYQKQQDGDWDTPHGKAQQHAMRTMAQISEDPERGDGSVQVSGKTGREPRHSQVAQIGRALKLSHSDLLLFILVHQEGYMAADLARWLGVTQGMVSLRLKHIVEKAQAQSKLLENILESEDENFILNEKIVKRSGWRSG